MEFFVAPRQEGKTTKMVEWLKAAPKDVTRFVVCISEREADRLQREVLGDKFQRRRFVSFESLRNRPDMFRGLGKVEIGIDDADVILQRMFYEPIMFITVTGTVSEPDKLSPPWEQS
jgi:hypothetical protein